LRKLTGTLFYVSFNEDLFDNITDRKIIVYR